MTKISPAGHEPSQPSPSASHGTADQSAPAAFAASLQGADKANPAPKRSADEAGLGGGTGNPPKARKPAKAPDGTYGTRKPEAARIGVTPGQKVKGQSTNTYQSEHVIPYAALHTGRGGSAQAHQTEAKMPASYQGTDLHQGHPGTGPSSNFSEERNDRTGWGSSRQYRSDINTAMNDPAARKTGSNVSNAYQLNQLGYGHQVAHQQRQDPTQTRPAPDPKVSDSYAKMVRHDPPVEHTAPDGSTQTDRLGPEGQVEAQLAHEVQTTGNYPTREREAELRAQFGI